MTPDDTVISNKKFKLTDFDPNKGFEKRARQNVIFEFCYFVGKHGRNKVCCLYKEGVEILSDIKGVIYKNVNKGLKPIELELIKKLKGAGLDPVV